MKVHCESPEEIRHRIWKELGRASQDRHHAWRTPVLATAGRDGMVNARTVVLRSVDPALQALRIFTDRRSPKVNEIDGDPNALFVFWSARLNWQLRVRVAITTQTAGPEVEAIWQRVQQSAAAGDYLGPAAPGSSRTDEHEAAATHAPTTPSTHNLAVLTAHILEMDWLELGQGGHRRARLRADSWEWLTP